jgi:hypothetical protein
MMIKPWVLIAGLALVSPASAQLLGGGGVGGTVGPLVGGVTGPLLDLPRGTSSVAARAIGDLGGPLMAVDGAIRDLSPADLLSLRRARLRALVRDHRAELDVDDDGNPIRRDTILAIGLAPGAVAAIRAAGFTITEADGASTLDIGVVTLTPPSGRSPRKALDTLRTLDPAATFSFDHIYEPAHAPLAPLPGVAPAAGSTEAGTRAPIGLIDGGVGQHAAFAGVMIEQRGFAAGRSGGRVSRRRAGHAAVGGGRLWRQREQRLCRRDPARDGMAGATRRARHQHQPGRPA